MTNGIDPERGKTYAERTKNVHHCMVYVPHSMWPGVKEAASRDGMPVSRWIVHTLHTRLVEMRLLAMGRPVEAIEEN